MKPNFVYGMGCLFRLGWATLFAIVILALVKHFIFDIMPVSGLSMFPTFHDRDVIVLNKISYLTSPPQRGDSIVLRFPGDPNHERYIKRLIGLPGETVKISDGHVYVNGQPLREDYISSTVLTEPDLEITLGPDDYYLLGDNRPVSSDSRIWGPAKKTDFIGKTYAIIWPNENRSLIPMPAY